MSDRLLVISEVRLGTWNYQGGTEALRKGLDAGAMIINEAKVYGAEPVVVQVLKAFVVGFSSRRKSLQESVLLACLWPVQLNGLEKILPLSPKTCIAG